MPRSLRAVLLLAVVGCCSLLGAYMLGADECGSETTPTAIVSDAPSQSTCARLDWPAEEDRWYFLTFRVDQSGPRDFRVPFSSDPSFSQTLESCAALGWFPRHRPAPTQAYLIQREDFSYIHSVKMRDVGGRRLVRLTLPEYNGLTGDLALRVEMSREGEVLGKEVLFSTDEKLGQMVLQDLENGLKVADPGEGPGPFIDILRLKIVNGTLAVFGQTHHMAKESM